MGFGPLLLLAGLMLLATELTVAQADERVEQAGVFIGFFLEELA